MILGVSISYKIRELIKEATLDYFTLVLLIVEAYKSQNRENREWVKREKRGETVKQLLRD